MDVLYRNRFLAPVLFIFALVLRCYRLSEIPAGLFQDEAMAAYQAFSLLYYGVDSWGYAYPMYFIAWGSGMNAGYSYLLMLFFGLFGRGILTVRLPQCFLGLMSLVVFYLLLKKIYNRKVALWGLFLATICPWHVMLSRFALESNLAPAFLLFGFYFYCLSVEGKKSYLYLSVLCYGLALYTYATCWVFLFFVLPVLFIYRFWHKREWRMRKYIFGTFCLFILLAFPVGLFLLVNCGIISEIKTAWFSVPKMVYWRGNEIGNENMILKAGMLWNVLVKQDDFLIWNRIPPFGLFYAGAPLLVLLGLYLSVKQVIKDFGEGQFSYSFCIVWQVVVGLIVASFMYVCINRINFLWFPLLICLTIGVEMLARKKVFFVCLVLFYIISAMFFIVYYFTKYNNVSSKFFSDGLLQVLEKTEELRECLGTEVVFVGHPDNYPKVLFYTETNVYYFLSTVKWQNYPTAYIYPHSFGHYYFVDGLPDVLDVSKIYIAPRKDKYFFYQFEITELGNYVLAVPKGYMDEGVTDFEI